ncbi:MAG: methenyltetrahydromethanopterin cyclohydrolase [Candidatus Bathyarchaeia archaeon]
MSVNRLAWNLLQKLIQNPAFYQVKIEKAECGVTVIDAGIRVKGGFKAGKIITEICMGGLGNAKIDREKYGDMELPTISVYTDQPVIATLGSQFAGWQVKEEKFSAIGSGPARALSRKPREIYEKIGYEDDYEKAVLVLETNRNPPDKLLKRLTEECRVNCENLAVILTPTASLAGSTQIAGRIVETGIHKLTRLGLDPKIFLSAWGCAPIPPVHPEFINAMARTNDAILYGGTTYYIVSCENEEELVRILEKAPSKASKDYGRPFIEIFKNAEYNFYKIDPNLFAPAVLIVNNIKTGRVLKAGEINIEALRHSFSSL